jgi:hypothetical protein
MLHGRTHVFAAQEAHDVRQQCVTHQRNTPTCHCAIVALLRMLYCGEYFLGCCVMTISCREATTEDGAGKMHVDDIYLH